MSLFRDEKQEQQLYDLVTNKSLIEAEDPWVVVKVITLQGKQNEYIVKSSASLNEILQQQRQQEKDDHGWLCHSSTGRLYNITFRIQNIWRDVYLVTKYYYLFVCRYAGVSNTGIFRYPNVSPFKTDHAKRTLISGMFQCLLAIMDDNTSMMTALEFGTSHEKWVDCSITHTHQAALFYWSRCGEYTIYGRDSELEKEELLTKLYQIISRTGGVNVESCAFSDGRTTLHYVMESRWKSKLKCVFSNLDNCDWNVKTQFGTPLQYRMAHANRFIYDIDEYDKIYAAIVGKMTTESLNNVAGMSYIPKLLLSTIQFCHIRTLKELRKRFPLLNISFLTLNCRSLDDALQRCDRNCMNYNRDFETIRDLVTTLKEQYKTYYFDVFSFLKAICLNPLHQVVYDYLHE